VASEDADVLPVELYPMPMRGGIDVELDDPAAAFVIPADCSRIEIRITVRLKIWSLT
jgi:hypothetical protein